LACPAISGDPARGSLLFESWPLDTGGWGSLRELTDCWDYPDKPHESFWQQIFERPDEGNNYFGERARGYLYPPETGDYTFWIASDDNSELYLSTDEDPAHAVLVANVTSWTGWRQWNAFASQQSPAIRLTAGKRYYIEALFCSGSGAGFLSVGWRGPGVTPGPGGRFDPAVIDGRYLAPFLRNPEPLLMAQSPAPADGAVAVNSRLLTWVAGPTAQQHDVYFGTSPNPPFIRRQTETTYTTPTLIGGTKYYWRIDEVEADGQTIHTGAVWSFTAVTAYPTDPDPADGARNVFPSGSVSWLAGRGSASHHLYSGPDRAAVAARTADADKGLLTDASFNAGVLRSTTTYYWLVDEIQSDGAVRKGPVWSFTTESAMPCAVLREWWTQIPGPRWIKLSRAGDTITAQHSKDGTAWRDLDGSSVVLPPAGDLYIGLALSSCNPWGTTTARFAKIQMTGGVTGSWAMKDVGITHPGNRSGPFYVTLRDASGKAATVNHPEDPLALVKMDWTQWKIPLSRFTGINTGAIAGITIGTGNGKSSTGDGALFLDDIRVIKSTSP
jgi:hypothetical protein